MAVPRRRDQEFLNPDALGHTLGRYRLVADETSTDTVPMKGPYLTNQLLIAMPALVDPNFAQTVTLICEHSDKGALGIVINRPMSMALGEVFEQLAMTPADPRLLDQPVLRGGPVQQDRGFVLQEGDHRGGGDGRFPQGAAGAWRPEPA